jgi:hypothetical protein
MSVCTYLPPYLECILLLIFRPQLIIEERMFPTFNDDCAESDSRPLPPIVRTYVITMVIANIVIAVVEPYGLWVLKEPEDAKRMG